MTNFFNSLKGYKTYFLALALVGYTLGGYFTGHMTLQEALGLLWTSGVVSSIRSAIANKQ